MERSKSFNFLAMLFSVSICNSASAADLTCSVPAANVARAVELCEELRLSMRVRPADWSNNICATEFLRIGLLAGERKSANRSAKAIVRNTVTDAMTAFTSTWSVTAPAKCGDGTLDTDFGEACDDGNNVNGDGCTSACAVE